VGVRPSTANAQNKTKSPDQRRLCADHPEKVETVKVDEIGSKERE
jgi:hypothetical protein